MFTDSNDITLNGINVYTKIKVCFESHINNHFFVNVSVSNHFTKLFKTNFSVSVLVSEENCLIHDLLQLCLFQIVTNHHLQYLELKKLNNCIIAETLKGLIKNGKVYPKPNFKTYLTLGRIVIIVLKVLVWQIRS